MSANSLAYNNWQNAPNTNTVNSQLLKTIMFCYGNTYYTPANKLTQQYLMVHRYTISS